MRGLQRCTVRAPDWAFDKRGNPRAPSWALSVELDQVSASAHVPVPGFATQGQEFGEILQPLPSPLPGVLCAGLEFLIVLCNVNLWDEGNEKSTFNRFLELHTRKASYPLVRSQSTV